VYRKKREFRVNSQYFGIMTDTALLSRITITPGVLGGRPSVRGLRISVMDILDMLADGASRVDILESYEDLEDADISAALAYASQALNHPVIAAE
jgi:uncharacterized protein (DUF433 family)